VDIRKIAKALKNELACGGTYKDDVIELQGDHTKKIKPILVRLGFNEESID
jgi:translation initiation factor 1